MEQLNKARLSPLDALFLYQQGDTPMKRELYLKNGKSDKYLVEYDEEGILAWFVYSDVTEDGWEQVDIETIKVHEPIRYTEALLYIDEIFGRF